MRAGNALDRLDLEIPTRTIDSTVRGLMVPSRGESRRSFASDSPQKKTRRARRWRRLCPRLSSCNGNNHKTYWSRIYIPSPILCLQEECLVVGTKERLEREGGKIQHRSYTGSNQVFSSTETFRSEKRPEKRERVKWKNNCRKWNISNTRDRLLQGISKIFHRDCIHR